MRDFLRVLVFTLFLAVLSFYTLTMLTGCAAIDFKNKGVAAETKVFGFEVTVPNIIEGTLGSFLTLRLGWIQSKYASAPAGTEVTIDNQYKDVSFWSMSGTITSLISIKNKQEANKYPPDAPLKTKE